MKKARIFVALMFCFSVFGLTGCFLPDSQSTTSKAASDNAPVQVVKSFRWPEGKRAAISLSFDDARLSQIDCGLDILDKYGVKATFYVLPYMVEKRLDGWKKAVASGHEIGNHSLTHPCTGNYRFSRQNALEDYTLEMIKHELDEADSQIERLLGVRPRTFAYPCAQKFVGRGVNVKSYIPLVAERFIVGRGGFDEVANDPAFCDLAQVTGIQLDGLDFEQVKELINAAAKEGRWLIFAGHEIGEPKYQTTNVSSLKGICEYAKDPANGLWIDTVQAVGEYIQGQRTGSKKGK